MTACKNRRWKLYRCRPKCHMHDHVMYLACVPKSRSFNIFNSVFFFLRLVPSTLTLENKVFALQLAKSRYGAPNQRWPQLWICAQRTMLLGFGLVWFCAVARKISKSSRFNLNNSVMFTTNSSPGYSCWQDEDYIGKCARISRRCHPLKVAPRTFTRVLMKYKRHLNQPLAWGQDFDGCAAQDLREKVLDVNLLSGRVTGHTYRIIQDQTMLSKTCNIIQPWYNSSTFGPLEQIFKIWYLNISIPKFKVQRMVQVYLNCKIYISISANCCQISGLAMPRWELLPKNIICLVSCGTFM